MSTRVTFAPAPEATAAAPRYGVRAAWMMTASGWSANQFSALLGAYRSELGLSESSVTGLFAVYVVGLIPGLLVGGPLADRRGRRRIALTALALNLLSTCLLMLGAGATGWLLPGRFVTGASAGVLLAAGGAWVKELSAPSPGAGRRAGLFVSAGFASGGLVAALIARWAPEPMVTAYVPHVVLAGFALAAAYGAPETAAGTAVGRRSAGRWGSPLLERSRELGGGWAQPPAPGANHQGANPEQPRVGKLFGRLILPLAPWVFAAPTIGFVSVPSLVHGGLIYAGVATALVPGAGLLVQPLARRAAARHRLATALVALATIAVGLAAATATVAAESRPLGLVAAAILGAGYGFALTYGLTEVTALAPPGRLARLTAYFWTAAYAGMFVPYAVTLLSDAGVLSPPGTLAATGALAVATALLLAALNLRRR